MTFMADTLKPIHLSYPGFDKIISKTTILLVFGADWSRSCNVQDNILEEAAKELEGNVLWGKVNVVDNLSIADECDILNIPNMFLFRNGDKIHQFVGAPPKTSLMTKIKTLIS
jgi:thioredoxin 1